MFTARYGLLLNIIQVFVIFKGLTSMNFMALEPTALQ